MHNPGISPLSDHSTVLHVIYGSRTGNSRSAAVLAHEYALFLGINSVLINMEEFNPENIQYLKNILVAVSTHGEGDPPIAAEKMLHWLSNEKEARMDQARFAVLALGDSSYRHFCKTGHDFSHHLQRLGAEFVYDLKECDIDYEEDAKKWVEGAVNAFRDFLPVKQTDRNKKFAFELVRPENQEGSGFRAKVISKVVLNADSPGKKTMLVTLSLKNSSINYQPGDSLGIFSSNSRRLVDELIRRNRYDPAYILSSGLKKEMLKQALIAGYELTLLTPVVIKKYASFSDNSGLHLLLNDNERLKQYCESSDISDLMEEYPCALTVEQFLSILRKLPPRLYSVASSPMKNPEEVQIMVGLVDYSKNDRRHEGVCSSFLSDRVDEGETIGIQLEENPRFRLPGDEVPVIMIGAGTGLAPFRAFLQERDEKKATGKNWLFFGERYPATDFFFRDELEGYVKSGLLTRLDIAFSREFPEKTYVTHKMLGQSSELFKWIEEGAVVFLSGNKHKLAVSVRKTLTEIIRKEGKLSEPEAARYLEAMKAQKRYREDVY
jgi:sulfite reductase (NADPH) flavoprotein alpha-component